MKIVFFDGYCSLCNNAVNILMTLDRKQNLNFASLQGTTAKTVLPPTNQSGEEVSNSQTIIYFRDDKTFERSDAVIEIAKDLGGVWKFASVLYAIPRGLRDAVYNFIARHRFSIFPKRDTCRVPLLHERGRMLP